MVNCKRFDPNKTLVKIGEVFWQKPYHALRIDDLELATSVKRQSLYNCYGNKDAMLLKAVEYYITKLEMDVFGLYDDESPYRITITEMVEAYQKHMINGDHVKGCFLLNNLGAFEFYPEHVQTQLNEVYKQFERRWMAVVEKAWHSGAISKQAKPRSRVQSFFTIIAGSQHMYKVVNDLSYIDRFKADMLQTLI